MQGLLTRPSAFVPIAMSVCALAIVVGYAATFGTARQADEGTAAHLWQLLMAGQVPVVAWFVFKGWPIDRERTSRVLAFQIGAALAAMCPVWWLGW